MSRLSGARLSVGVDVPHFEMRETLRRIPMLQDDSSRHT